LVTVATLLIPFRFLVEPGRNQRIACTGWRTRSRRRVKRPDALRTSW
jgi:hypothetical protein